jgi:hypothetical protein
MKSERRRPAAALSIRSDPPLKEDVKEEAGLKNVIKAVARPPVTNSLV